MKKPDIVANILGERLQAKPINQTSEAYAPINIALCKYWGKRNSELNLPVTSSLSITLPSRGCTTKLSLIDAENDEYILNGERLAADSSFVQRSNEFLDLFRRRAGWRLKLEIDSNIPIAAGFASSASGFAALVKALNHVFAWDLSEQHLSILARMGSGSACRSLWNGFVEWQRGEAEDGMDCYAEPISPAWPDLCIGLLTLSGDKKTMSSRQAMQQTVATSMLYKAWPEQVARDLTSLKQAIKDNNFIALAECAESNALAMHATMLACWPPISYMLPETIAARQKIWQARKDGLKIYFTQDAGPNLKLLVQKKDISDVSAIFTGLEVITLSES